MKKLLSAICVLCRTCRNGQAVGVTTGSSTGVTSVVPVPGSLPLMAICLMSLLAFRSREKFAFLRKSRRCVPLRWRLP